MTKVPLGVLLLLGVVCLVNGQADKNKSYTIDQVSLTDKALFLGDFLVTHPEMFRKLLNIQQSSAGLISAGGNDPRFGKFMNYLLDQVPGILKSPETAAILGIVIDEFERVNATNVNAEVEMFAHKNNITDKKVLENMVMQLTLQKFDKLRTVQRILTRHSARDFVPMTKTDSINDVCYNDMMNFWDALISAQIPPRSRLNYTFVPWAITMFDSFGKPAEGITKGNLFWVGSYDLCRSVKAELPAGVILGNRTLSAPVNFKGKYCRLKFALPDSFIDSFGVDTHGVKVKMDYGICVPNSCRKDDVAQMFNLGVMKRLGINPEKVSCAEDEDISEDASGIVAAVIVVVFVVVAFFTTAVDGVLDWMKDNLGLKKEGFEIEEKPSGSNGVVLIEKTGNINKGYMPDTGEGTSNGIRETKMMEDVPPSYVPHQNDKGDLGVEYYRGPSPKLNGTSPVPKATETRPQKPRESLGSRLMKAFSLYTNMPKILNANKNPNAIHCLHGIRFFSMLWIILGHTYNYGIFSGADTLTTANVIDASELIERFTFQGVMAAGFAVDTFFLLSAFLVCYLTLKDLTKKKVTPGYLGMFYFHRFWRLTPVYMIVLMCFACFYKYFGSGPMWPGTIAAAENCKTHWWTNLLYVNNLVYPDDNCMGWSWYLANDMQFYIISPLFILFMHFIPVVGVVLTVCMMCAGVGSAFYKEYTYGGDMFRMNENPHYWSQVYITPWCRVSAYCVGLLLGFIMFKVKKGSLKNLHALAGWCLTIFVGLTLCYVTYDYRGKDKEPWTPAGMGAFESFGRPIWCACISWIIFACHNGKGGFVDNILSFSGIIPLSRLTYAAYLLHPVMMIIHVFSKRALLYINDYDIAYLYIGHTICTYMAAFGFSLLFEAPFLTLEKILFQRRGHSN